MESKVITRHINKFLLDPNNYRFIDHKDYKAVPDELLSDNRIQQRTFALLSGKSNENIIDLVYSYKANGILKLDPIQVRQVGDNYLVVEGNRRMAALKFLYEEFKNNMDVGLLAESSFKSLEVIEIIDDDPKQHLITMGLYHISGKKRWNPVNQAQLIFDLINRYGMTEDEICAAVTVSKHGLRRSLRTLALIESYKKSDFGDQFEANMYSIFEEVIKRTEMKTWLNWHDDTMSAHNKVNEEKLFSWLSKEEIIEREEEDGEEEYKTQEPIITKSQDVREVSKFINDSKAVEKMENTRLISQGFAFSDAIGEAKLHNSLENIKTEVQTAFSFSEYMSESDYTEISKLRDKLDKLLPSNNGNIAISEKKALLYFQSVQKHFDTLNISSYRKLINLNVKNLNRINIFAGNNNSGKTSMLEAFYLTSQLNDINAFLDLEKLRGKFYADFPSKWVLHNFPNEIEINGSFNNESVSLLITNEETEEGIDKTNYLSTINIEAKVNGLDLQSYIHLFSNRESELYYHKSQILCPASFTSPYRYNTGLLKRAHAFAVKEKQFDLIIDFIRQNIDKRIEKIEMVNPEGESRFYVSASNLNQSIDITKYGEGLQRVFEIALLLVYNQNGILCIDEVDSAIHRNLLVEFTKFIQVLADKFNVQVFLSTHSKECIDAFIENGYKNSEITAYSLVESENKIACKYIEGNRLEKLIENLNIDIR